MILLCALDALPERQARGFEAGGLAVFALKLDGAVYAYRNSCPHLGVELNWREHEFFDRDGALLQCAMHGALFAPDSGECVAGPCRGQRLQALRVHIENAAVYVEA